MGIFWMWCLYRMALGALCAARQREPREIQPTCEATERQIGALSSNRSDIATQVHTLSLAIGVQYRASP
jgi:hypothetical protein